VNIGWLVLWATLQVGYVPMAWDNGVTMQGVEYVEPGFGAKLFNVLTVEGSIRTYIQPKGFAGGLPDFWPSRDTYTIDAHVDPSAWLRVGFHRWCSHEVDPYEVVAWPGDQGASEFYARLKVGG